MKYYFNKKAGSYFSEETEDINEQLLELGFLEVDAKTFDTGIAKALSEENIYADELNNGAIADREQAIADREQAIADAKAMGWSDTMIDVAFGKAE